MSFQVAIRELPELSFGYFRLHSLKYFFLNLLIMYECETIIYRFFYCMYTLCYQAGSSLSHCQDYKLSQQLSSACSRYNLLRAHIWKLFTFSTTADFRLYMYMVVHVLEWKFSLGGIWICNHIDLGEPQYISVYNHDNTGKVKDVLTFSYYIHGILCQNVWPGYH